MDLWEWNEMMNVILIDVKEVREIIKNIVKRIDLFESVKFSEKIGVNVFYKCENF